MLTLTAAQEEMRRLQLDLQRLHRRYDGPIPVWEKEPLKSRIYALAGAINRAIHDGEGVVQLDTVH